MGICSKFKFKPKFKPFAAKPLAAEPFAATFWPLALALALPLALPLTAGHYQQVTCSKIGHLQ